MFSGYSVAILVLGGVDVCPRVFLKRLSKARCGVSLK